MSDALPLPPRPNLDQYRKLAKDFQHACKSGGPDAIRDVAARWVEKLGRLQGVEMTPEIEARRIEQRWQKLKAKCTLTAAQFFVAREHGFASWPKFSAHLKAMARANSPVSNFERAADAIVSGDLPALKKLLAANPELVRTRSTRDHRSTLLHYVSANGIEDFRQKTPKNIVEITHALLDAGADVNAESDAYGGRSSSLGLAATSLHPQQAGVQIALLQTLLDRGAKLDEPSAGNGNSIINGCLANGQPEAAEFFANLGAPLDLEAAAALGRLELVKNYFDGATEKQLESAFLYACGYAQREVVEFLLEKGVSSGVRNSDGQTGLHWAAYGGSADIARLLLQHSAPVEVKDRGFDATPLDVALWVWTRTSDKGEREGSYEVVALLIRAGAKLDSRWLEGGQPIERIRQDPRMMAALNYF